MIMRNAEKKYDIFISYRRDGGQKDAKLLESALTNLGYRVFLDMTSMHRGFFDEQLYRRIDECTDFVLVLPPNALDRCKNEKDWVRMEIEYALAQKKNIIPIMLNGFSFPADLPDSISSVKNIQGIEPPSMQFFDAYIDVLTHYLKSKPIQHIHISINKWFVAALCFLAAVCIAVALKWIPFPPVNPPPSPLISTGPVVPVQTDAPEIKPVFQPGIDNVLMRDLCDDQTEAAADAFLLRSEIKRSQIKSITFLDSLEQKPQDAWDVSEKLDDSVMAWVTQLPAGMYKLFIAGEGGVSAPKDCSWLFNGYVNLEIVDFNKAFHTDETTNMYCMFRRCSALHTIDVSNFKTANVKNLGWMFTICSNLERIDLSSFDTAKVEIMEGMFAECSNIESILLGDHFNTSNVTSIYSFLWGCSKLRTIDVSGFDMSNAKYLDKMFCKCSSLEVIDVSGFHTGEAERIADMFYGCASVKKLDLSGFDTSKIRNMSGLFSGCKSLEELILGEGFNTSSVENMYAMFYECECLPSVDVSRFNTSNVNNMSYMFYGCTGLASLDVSHFDISNVTSYDSFMPDDLNPDWRSMFEK